MSLNNKWNDRIFCGCNILPPFWSGVIFAFIAFDLNCFNRWLVLRRLMILIRDWLKHLESFRSAGSKLTGGFIWKILHRVEFKKKKNNLRRLYSANYSAPPCWTAPYYRGMGSARAYYLYFRILKIEKYDTILDEKVERLFLRTFVWPLSRWDCLCYYLRSCYRSSLYLYHTFVK